MIERLLVTLRFFAEGGEPEGADRATVRRAADDFLDAYRLIMDCPQYDLGATARAALTDVEAAAERLGGEGGQADARRRELEDARDAARRALAALGADES